jgi:transposase InsO family protein
VLDAFSRRIVGWSMADHLAPSSCWIALDMAIAQRQPAPGLVHLPDGVKAALEGGHDLDRGADSCLPDPHGGAQAGRSSGRSLRSSVAQLQVMPTGVQFVTGRMIASG